MDKPDNNNITVFNKGILHGFNTIMFTGGQIKPMKTDGDKLE